MVSVRRTSRSGDMGTAKVTSRRGSAPPRKKLRQTRVRDEGSRERSIPPVMVRGADVSSFPLQGSKRLKAKPRRRYDVALSMPGVEMRLPSLPQVAVGWRLVSFILVAALGALVYHLWNSPQYHVQAAEISGLQRIKSADVNALLDVRGASIFGVSPRLLEDRLQQAFPEFSSVDVSVGLPAEVIVEVDERQPVLAWHQEGRTVLVDANGVAFPMRDQDAALPPLVIEAHGAPPASDTEALDPGLEQFMPVEMVSAVFSMSGQAPKNSPILYDPQRGLGWKDASGWEVYFGNTSSMDIKLKVYKSIAMKLDDEGIVPALISVEHVHLPYYRLER